MPLYKDFTIPTSPTSPQGQELETTGLELRGFATRLLHGRPKRLVGNPKLEDDITFIALGVLLQSGLLRTSLAPAQRGLLADQIREALEDEANWFPGQPVPISLSDVRITRRSITPVGGVVVGRGDEEGNLEVIVSYSEQSVGVEVSQGAEQVVIPFGAFAAEVN
jgi:hypothetical protein